MFGISLPVPTLTRPRIALAFAAAIIADIVPWVLGPFGILWLDEIVDVIAMVVTSAAIGFHPLLLPTFVLEIVPFVDMLPTWTGCVAALVALRRSRSPGSLDPGSRAPGL